MPARDGPSSPVMEPLGVDPVVGDYKVLRRLGKGGMGDVYEAVHALIGKRVALKVLSHEAAARPEAAQRFLLEAQTVNAIGHPNIVDIFGFGQLPDGRKYFVMELLEGEPLWSYLKEHAPLPPQDVVELLDQILDALGAVHAAGIVHRDLKPGNIFVVNAVRGGRYVKLLDFGIAKELHVERNLTGTFDVLGTPQYMAPEQARGTATTSSDLYSLGCITFVMLTGQHAFRAENMIDLVTLHLTQPPPRPSTLVGGVPVELEELVLQLLEKEPANRPRDTLAVRAELAEIRRRMKGAQTMIVHAPLARREKATPTSAPSAVSASASARVSRDEDTVNARARNDLARTELGLAPLDGETRASSRATLLDETSAHPRPPAARSPASAAASTRPLDATTTDTSTPSLGTSRPPAPGERVPGRAEGEPGLARPRRWPFVAAAAAVAAIAAAVMLWHASAEPGSATAEELPATGPAATPTGGTSAPGSAAKPSGESTAAKSPAGGAPPESSAKPGGESTAAAGGAPPASSAKPGGESAAAKSPAGGAPPESSAKPGGESTAAKSAAGGAAPGAPTTPADSAPAKSAGATPPSAGQKAGAAGAASAQPTRTPPGAGATGAADTGSTRPAAGGAPTRPASSTRTGATAAGRPPATKVTRAGLTRDVDALRAHAARTRLPRSALLLLEDLSESLAKAKTDAELRALAGDLREWRTTWGGP